MKQPINHYKFMLGFIVLLVPILACGFFEATPLEKARQAVSAGDIPTAMQEYSTTIDGEGSSAEDRFNALVERADLQRQQGHTEAALADYAISLQLTSNEGQPAGNLNSVYRKRAELYSQQAAWEQAVADWDAIITAQPNNYDALAKRGYAHLQLRNYEQAIADLKASFEGDVGDAKANVDSRSNLVEAYSDLGFVLLTVGEYEDALKNYDQAYELAQGTPDEADVLTDRGFAYSEIDLIDEAFADLSRAIELAPNQAMAYAYRSYVYGAQYQYDEAIADASKAVELGSDLPAQTRSAILHSRAMAYASTEQYQLAVADATASLS